MVPPRPCPSQPRGGWGKHLVPHVPFPPYSSAAALGSPQGSLCGPRGRSPQEHLAWPQQRTARINVPRANTKPPLNPRGWGIGSPLPMFILRRKCSSWRHPSPGPKGLGGTLGGWWSSPPHPTCPSGSNAKRHGGCAAPLPQGTSALQDASCPREHPRTC